MMVASELFPLQVRGFALGVATLVNRATSGTIALTFVAERRHHARRRVLLLAALALVACLHRRAVRPRDEGQVAGGD